MTGIQKIMMRAGGAAVALGGVLLIGSIVAREPEPSPVLLLQTGWTSALDGISLADLKTQYCTGRIAVTPGARLPADTRFGCAPSALVISAEQFYPRSRDRWILVRLEDAIARMKTADIDGVFFFSQPQRYMPGLPVETVSADITHYILTGVSALTRYTGKSADEHGVGILSEKVRPYFQNADYVHVSNEVSFMNGCVFAPGTRFCSKEQHFQAYRDIRANIVELTGNHTRDFGDEPFVKTFAWFGKQGMKTFGGGLNEGAAAKPLSLSLKGGGSIVLAGFNELCPLKECAAGALPGANRYTREKAASTLAAIRRESPGAFVMATVQFGEVNSYKPTETQRRISYDLADLGADLVFGSQAHQVQQMEFRNGRILLHGLGNFFFDQTHTFGLRQGYFMNLYFYRGKLAAMRPVFTWIDERFRPVPANAEQARQIKESIFSDDLLYR